MRSAILEMCRAAFMTSRGKDPGDVPSQIAERQQRLLHNVMSLKHQGRADQLEKMANACVRMILLAQKDPAFVGLTEMNWRRAITIARWADVNIAAARDEMLRTEDDGSQPGTRDTERRYKAATASPAGADRKDAVRQHRLSYDMLEENGFAGLDASITHFEQFGFGRYVCHVLARELPRLAAEARADDIETITSIVQASGVASYYLQPTAAFVLRHRITEDMATKKALDALTFLDVDRAIADRFRELVDGLIPKPKRKVTADVLAWRNHPRWSRIPMRAAADYGRRMFQRNVHAWIMATEENGDPDNHPLNFIEYDRRYGQRDSMLLLGDPVR
jgi:hypothetical protein